METTTITLRIPISLEDEINALALKSGINKNKIGNQCLRNAEFKILHNIKAVVEERDQLKSEVERLSKIIEIKMDRLKEKQDAFVQISLEIMGIDEDVYSILADIGE